MSNLLLALFLSVPGEYHHEELVHPKDKGK